MTPKTLKPSLFLSDAQRPTKRFLKTSWQRNAESYASAAETSLRNPVISVIAETATRKKIHRNMTRTFLFSFLLLAAPPLSALPKVEFNRDIRPILSDRCYYCHGPDEKTQEADLRLDTREGALADGAIVPGKPEESELFYRITTHDEDDIMPQPKAKKPKLNAQEIALFKRWIEEGAEYQGHWAFEPVAKTEAPADTHPVDYFIDKRLEKEGINPSPITDRATLIRRVYLDLVGLLPTREQVDAFVKDTRPDAYERVVDQLLASRHYGERWGRHWLDGARYADSHGYAVDGGREMWPYRDWVIRALNDDMPFNQFTIEQIAGDLLPNSTKSQQVATGFHRNTLINQEGGSDPEQFRVEATIDRTNTTGAVWLGLTVGCAQCHTHKFDPLQHREYYELFAFFNNAEDRNNTGPTVEVTEGELFEKAIAQPKPIVKSTPAEKVEVKWTTAGYQSSKTTSGTTLHKQDDNSLLIDKKFGDHEAYQIVSDSGLEKLAAVRLRTLTDQALPKNGPGKAGNGNFVLTNIKIFVGGVEQPISYALADVEQSGYPVAHAIDKDKKSGWAINVGDKMNSNHEAIFVLTKPVETRGKPVEVRLFHDLHPDYLVGRFAIDFANTAPPARSNQQPEASKAKGKVMVMRDLKTPRDSYILTRGDFTRPDKDEGKLSPGVFAAIAPTLQKSDKPRNRLDLAKWLIHPENPLTSRVTVNRMWMRYFGRGLVETEEDFGSQGSPPSHPELLDFLARKFIEDGWSMKKMHRLIVTSGTYQRSSAARTDLADKDPLNLLLARQSRVRVDAELIRDVALSASGLLRRKVGGPSVYPPQPDGIYAFTQSRKGWNTSTGEDRYRRAMYTFFYRSAPYPLFGTFDAPDFQTTCTSRARSNTPLQALNIANDEAFLEFARGMAARIVEEIPGEAEANRDARILRAFEHAMARLPSEVELGVLSKYGKALAADFKKSTQDAQALLNSYPIGGLPDHEAAALVTVARAIFNTDNFITRE